MVLKIISKILLIYTLNLHTPYLPVAIYRMVISSLS